MARTKWSPIEVSDADLSQVKKTYRRAVKLMCEKGPSKKEVKIAVAFMRHGPNNPEAVAAEVGLTADNREDDVRARRREWNAFIHLVGIEVAAERGMKPLPEPARGRGGRREAVDVDELKELLTSAETGE